MNLILGFNGLSESTSNGTLTAPNRYNLNIDNYLNMQILNFGNNQNVNKNSIKIAQTGPSIMLLLTVVMSNI